MIVKSGDARGPSRRLEGQEMRNRQAKGIGLAIVGGSMPTTTTIGAA
jgi:hypothetical protein